MSEASTENRPLIRNSSRPSPWPTATLGALSVTVAIAIFIIGYVGRSSEHVRRLEAEILSVHQRGEPLEAKDLSDLCPLTSNEAARTKRWLRLAELAEPTGKFTDDARPLPFIGELHVPDDALSQPGAETLREQAHGYLQKHGDALQLAHELAKDPGPVYFQQRFEDGFNATFPWVVSLRALNRVLAIELRLRLVEGDIEGATSSWFTQLALSEALRPPSCGVSCGLVQSIRYSMILKAFQQAEFLINHVNLSNAKLQQIQNRVLRLELERDLKPSMLGERMMGFSGFQHPEQIFADGPSDKTPQENLASRAEDCLLYLASMLELIELCDLPFAECRRRANDRLTEALDRIRPFASSGDERFAGSQSLLPGAVVFGIESAAEPIASRGIIMLAIASRRFALQHNRLPTNLYELVPEFCSEIPVDPYSGSALLSKSSANGLLIYSLGKNGIDDEGTNDRDSGDISFEILSTISAR
jgi:hypothetical protein